MRGASAKLPADEAQKADRVSGLRICDFKEALLNGKLCCNTQELTYCLNMLVQFLV